MMFDMMMILCSNTYGGRPPSQSKLQMRLKDPFSLKAADMTKRTNKPRKPRDEESSDEVSGKSLKQYRAPDRLKFYG